MAGVFISRGMAVGIPAGGLTIGIGSDGKPTSSLVLHVHFDVSPTWLELAAAHLTAARLHSLQRAEAWSRDDEDAKASTLEREFESSMQAIVAAAIAIDAFYAVLQKRVQIPQAIVASWRRNKTARYVQVTEVLKTAFGLRGKGLEALSGNLREIYRLRDLAVHPSGQLDAPILHPELQVGVEWRFAYFWYRNADAVVRAAARVLIELTNTGKPKNRDVRNYADGLKNRLAEIGAKIDSIPTITEAAAKPAEA
jgi:hypothetical protein